ncbi:MAG: hypothetical protein MRY83_08195 [Flavobacteriales bacterium]|nr:hypothetical protein [Flavobacteriales bacterium]
MVVVGLFVFFKNTKSLLKIGLCIITLVFFGFIAKTGSVFPLHGYYIIPFVPVMALIAGYGLEALHSKSRFAILLLVAIGLEGLLNQQHDFFLSERKMYLLDLEGICETYIPKKDLIVVNGNNSPSSLYYTNRKGWIVSNEHLENDNHLDSLMHLGAKYMIIDKNSGSMTDSMKIFEDDNFSLYSLKR